MDHQQALETLWDAPAVKSTVTPAVKPIVGPTSSSNFWSSGKRFAVVIVCGFVFRAGLDVLRFLFNKNVRPRIITIDTYEHAQVAYGLRGSPKVIVDKRFVKVLRFPDKESSAQSPPNRSNHHPRHGSGDTTMREKAKKDWYGGFCKETG